MRFWRARANSIQARLVALALAAIAPFIALEGCNLYVAHVEKVKAAEDHARRLTEHATERYADMVDEARALLDLLAEVPDTVLSTPESCTSFMSRIARSRPWARGLWASDETGKVTCTNYPGAIGIDISDRPWFPVASKSGFTISDMFIGKFNNMPMTMATLSRPASPDLPSRVFATSMDLSHFDKIGAAAIDVPGASTMLIDGSGAVISHTPAAAPLASRNFRDNPVIAEMRRTGKGLLRSAALEGTDRFYGYTQLPGTSVLMVIGIPSAPVMNAALDSIVWTTVFSLLMLALAASLAIGLGRHFVVSPLRRLAWKTSRIGHGDLSVRVGDLKAGREFAATAKAFDSMANRIQRREAELVEANARLQEREKALESANQILDDLASLDGLTGIANRRRFEAAFGAAWDRAAEDGKPIGLLLIDVDHFKRFNDTRGHLAGDDCLRRIARLVRAAPRRGTDLAARYGGEEFAVLLPGSDATYAMDIADALRKAIQDQRIGRRGAEDAPVTVSIGVAAMTHAEAARRDALIEAADAALYDAKVGGRNRVILASRPAATLVPDLPRTSETPAPARREWLTSRHR